MNLVDSPNFRMILRYWAERRFAALGFSGSPCGLTPGQKRTLRDLLRAAKDTVGLVQLHHCACAGSDEEAHWLAVELGVVTVIHPHSRAVYDRSPLLMAEQTRPKWPALRAVQDIVEEVSLALAAPSMGPESENVHSWDLVTLARRKPIAVMTLAPEVQVGRRAIKTLEF